MHDVMRFFSPRRDKSEQQQNKTTTTSLKVLPNGKKESANGERNAHTHTHIK